MNACNHVSPRENECTLQYASMPISHLHLAAAVLKKPMELVREDLLLEGPGWGLADRSVLHVVQSPAADSPVRVPRKSMGRSCGN